MAKITVKNNIKYKNQELQLVLESAASNDIRSSVNLVSPNDIAIQNTNTQRKFCLARNEDIFKEHKIKLYTDDGTTKYFAKKGTRPKYSELSEVLSIPNNTFTLTYNDSTKTTRLSSITQFKWNNNQVFNVDIPYTIFYLLVSGSGGGGCGSRTRVTTFGSYISSGTGGGSGSSVFLLVDMSKILVLKITTGSGGSGSSEDKTGGTGGTTKILFNNSSYINLLGGKGGGLSGYDYGWLVLSATFTNDNAGAGGRVEYSTGFNKNMKGLKIIKEYVGSKGNLSFNKTIDAYGTESSQKLIRQFLAGDVASEKRYSRSGAGSVFSKGGNAALSFGQNGSSGEYGSGGGGAHPCDGSWWVWNEETRSGGNGGSGAFQIFY